MNYRTDHPDWPKLTSADLENKKRCGKDWICTCPVCHTHHLSVDRQRGIFKCWYIGCEFRGILEDYRKDPAEYRSKRKTAGTLWHDSCFDEATDGWQTLSSDDDSYHND